MKRHEDGTDTVEGTGSGSVAYYFGQILFIPFRTLVYGMEMLLEAVRGVQRAGDRGIHLLAGGTAAHPAAASEPVPDPAAQDLSGWEQGGAAHGAEIVTKETERMDKDLNDDTLKLVRYKILFVKRDYEHAFPEQEELISDNMDGSAFTAWKVAQFIQSLHPDGIKIPDKWKSYPKDAKYRKNGHFTGLPEEDKKYLRVFYEVMERYPREKLKYEEDQLTVLREIAHNLAPKKADGGGTGDKSIDVG
jgi:hypothetical protein